MPSTPLILIVDDDPHIREVVRFALDKAGLRTVEAADGREALAVAERTPPDLVVLDVLMPEHDGLEVGRRLRAAGPVPIIFLTSKADEIDRIVGLELGGDDYVTKPFSPRELVARVRAVLRRGSAAPAAGGAEIKARGRLRLDPERVQVQWDERDVALTATEFRLLAALMGVPGKVYSRDQLMQRAYPDDSFVFDRTVDSHVRRIRKKFADAGGAPVETVHGIGYRLGSCE